MKEIKLFRIWVNGMENGVIQEYPTEICFNSQSEVVKVVKYLNSKRTSESYAYYFKPETTTIFKTAQEFVEEKEMGNMI